MKIKIRGVKDGGDGETMDDIVAAATGNIENRITDGAEE